jgi:long-chain acyl-CoA synthetase
MSAYRSIPEMFLDRITRTPENEAFQFPGPGGNGWRAMTWRESGARVRAIACGLAQEGLAPEQRCAILSGTRVEWIFADLAILCAAGATTTIYPSSTGDECAYILADSETAYCFVENDAQVKKLQAKRAQLPALKRLIVFDGAGDGDWVISLDELAAKGAAWDAIHPGKYEERARAVRPEQLATLIYTSGTTGQPKGVELTHDCWVYEGEAIDALGLIRADDRQYLWLPLAHSFGKVLMSAQVKIGFATTVDGRIDKLVDNLSVVKPTFVAAVPRIFEKVHNKVVAGAKEGGGAKAKIFDWAMDVGRRVSRLTQQGRRPGLVLEAERAVADRLVFSKLKARFGGRVRYFISGSAPLDRELAEFFHAAGILILEGYGLTESSAATFVNRPDRYKFGTVGLPLSGTQVQIAAADGEILVKGRGVMRGYRNLAAETRETLDADGWLHTGDIGTLLPGGFLQITDRKKDLIKTSGGKYVAPQMLEGKLKTQCPYVSQIVVHGNNRNFCTALIAIDEEATRKWARDHVSGAESLTYAQLAARSEVIALIQGYVDELNKELPSYETIKKIALLPADLTQEAGDLTPSLKVKRKAVEQRYKSVLDGFYAGANVGAGEGGRQDKRVSS